MFLQSAALTSFIFFLTLYLQNALRFDALQTGIRLLPMTVLVGIAAPIAGRFTDKIGPRWIIVGGLAVGAAGIYLATRITPLDGQAQWTVLVPAFILLGIGLGAANAPILTVAVGTVEEAKGGAASAVNSVCRQIGTAFGIAFLSALLTTHYNGTVAHMVRRDHEPGHPRALTGAIRKAGPDAGSASLRHAPPRLKQSAAFPRISKETRAAWIDSFVYVMRIAALFVAIGAAVAFLTIRKRDLRTADRAPARGSAGT